MIDDKTYKVCQRCGRKLKDYNSKRLGYGQLCYKKYLSRQKVYLFDMPIKNISPTEILDGFEK